MHENKRRLRAVGLYLQGLPISEIMEQCSTSKWGLYLWLKKEGIDPNRGVDLDLDEVVEKIKNGVSSKEIAAEAGCSNSCVLRLLKKKGFPAPWKIRKYNKTCPICKTTKPFTSDFFYNDRTRVHGLAYNCKQCAKLKQKKIRESKLDQYFKE